MGGFFMFNLNESIKGWKAKLGNCDSFTGNDIEELESHLLDEIESLKEKELSEEEAFYIASSRLGEVDLLSSEFSKVNEKPMYLRKVALLLGGYLLIYFIQQLIRSILTLLSIIIEKANIVHFHAELALFPGDQANAYINIGISVFLALMFIYVLLKKKNPLLLKIQLVFNYLYNANKILLFSLYSILIIINSIGYMLLVPIIIRSTDIQTLGSISNGNSLFGIIWIVVLSVSFIVIVFRKNKKEQLA